VSGSAGGVTNTTADPSREMESSTATTANNVPPRNYIDLRMEQNKMFAEERYKTYIQLCNKINNRLADTKQFSTRGNKEWEMMKSCITEGLAAYPDHKGLLQAQVESMNYMQYHPSRQEDVVEPPPAPVIQTGHDLEKMAPQNNSKAFHNDNTWQLKEKQLHRKGAEYRAQAAIRDALLERSFLSQSASATAAVGEYNLLPEEDEACEQVLDNTDKNQKKHNDDSSDDSRGSSSREERHRRRRKRRKEHGREKKRRKHHKHEKKKYRRQDERRRSKQRSRSSSVS
jgi:hypothetical protein